jgi:hypothetical protein
MFERLVKVFQQGQQQSFRDVDAFLRGFQKKDSPPS